MKKSDLPEISTEREHICSWRLVGVFQGGIFKDDLYQLIYQCRICDEVKQEIRDYEFKLKKGWTKLGEPI